MEERRSALCINSAQFKLETRSQSTETYFHRVWGSQEGAYADEFTG